MYPKLCSCTFHWNWGLIPHVPKVTLMYPFYWEWVSISHVPLMYPLLFSMYPSLRLGFDLSCTPHVPPLLLQVPYNETGFWSLMYPSYTPFHSQYALHWDWGLISHVPLMYPLSFLHVPFIDTGFWSLMYPSCTPSLSPCTLQWDWVSISHVPLMYPLCFFKYPTMRLGFDLSCTPHVPHSVLNVPFISHKTKRLWRNLLWFELFFQVEII